MEPRSLERSANYLLHYDYTAQLAAKPGLPHAVAGRALPGLAPCFHGGWRRRLSGLLALAPWLRRVVALSGKAQQLFFFR